MATHRERSRERRLEPAAVRRYLRILVYGLTTVLGFALLSIGTVAIIAELKGTWHWQIHLDSTVRYVGLFVHYLLVVLVPLFVVHLLARWRWSDA